MRSRAAQLFPVLLVLIVALATLWLERLVQLPAAQVKDKERHDPDFIVENFTLTRMSPRGKPESSLTAPKMLHYPDDETTTLDQPRYRQHSEGRPPIEIVAESGTISKDGEIVYLVGGVVVTRAGVDGRPPLEMQTTKLEIEPKNEIARTGEPVTIIEGASVVNGVGMVVQGKTREFELQSRVRGTLEQGTLAGKKR